MTLTQGGTQTCDLANGLPCSNQLSYRVTRQLSGCLPCLGDIKVICYIAWVGMWYLSIHNNVHTDRQYLIPLFWGRVAMSTLRCWYYLGVWLLKAELPGIQPKRIPSWHVWWGGCREHEVGGGWMVWCPYVFSRYRIAGKFGGNLNLVVWRSGLKSPN